MTACRSIASRIPFARWHLGRLRNCRNTQCRYFALDKQAGKLMRKLCREDDPGFRAVLLDDLAVVVQEQADIYAQAFGPDPIEYEGGRDMAESETLSAQLAGFAAACEHDLAGTPAADVFPADPAAPWPPAYCVTFMLLRGVRDRAERARILDEFADDVVDEAGGQAAETLVSLANAERETARRMS